MAMHALTYCYEGYNDSYPYACTIAVSEDIDALKAKMKECVDEDCEIDEEDEWNFEKNFKVESDFNTEIVLRHTQEINLYAKYRISPVLHIKTKK